MSELVVVEYANQRILTTRQIAELYGTTEKIISYNFNHNKEHYSLGKHYYALEGKDKTSFLKDHRDFQDGLKNAKVVYLWTEKGALMHAKSVNTDKAWEVYEELVDRYFRVQDEQPAQQQYVNADFVLRLRLNAGRVPYDHWTVLEQIDKESHHSGLGLVNLINKARPDISVGKKWSNHLKKNGYDTSQFMMVPNIVHPGNMHEEDVRAYSLDLLPLFLRWLHEEYKEHFVKCYLPPRKEQKRLA